MLPANIERDMNYKLLFENRIDAQLETRPDDIMNRLLRMLRTLQDVERGQGRSQELGKYQSWQVSQCNYTDQSCIIGQ